MNLDKLYISTIAKDAFKAAKEYGLGIEIADFCTAWNMDDAKKSFERIKNWCK